MDAINSVLNPSSLLNTGEDIAVREVDSFAPDDVNAVVNAYPFLPYRRWRRIGAGVPAQLVRWDLLFHPSKTERTYWIAMRKNRPVGLAVIEPCLWESTQLKRRIAQVRYLMAIGNNAERHAIACAIINAIRTRMNSHIECLVYRVDCEDNAIVAAVETKGFHLVDTMVSFIAGREIISRIRRRLRPPSGIRPATSEDWPEIETIVRGRHFGGRFYRDWHFSQRDADELYVEWARACCKGQFADQVIVGLHGKQMGGFLTYQRQSWMHEAAGLRLMGRGLLAVSPTSPGLSLKIVQGALLLDPDCFDCVQFDMHLENHRMFELCGRLLRMNIAHVQHVFHGWIGETKA